MIRATVVQPVFELFYVNGPLYAIPGICGTRAAGLFLARPARRKGKKTRTGSMEGQAFNRYGEGRGLRSDRQAGNREWPLFSGRGGPLEGASHRIYPGRNWTKGSFR